MIAVPIDNNDDNNNDDNDTSIIINDENHNDNNDDNNNDNNDDDNDVSIIINDENCDDNDIQYVYSTSSRDSQEITTTRSSKTLNEREYLEFMMILFGSAILAFNAGYVNGCTYQSLAGKGKPVSHVTGTTTKAGLFAADHEYNDMLVNLAIIMSFCFGAGISGGFISSSTFSLGLEYGPLLVIGSILFFLSSMLLYFAPKSYLGFYLASMACGLQNSLTTTYSGNIIRTTHMTGTVTDIGIVLGKYLVKNEVQELWKLKILIPLLISFLIGGVVSRYIFLQIGDLAICLSSAFFLIIGSIYSILVSTHLNQSCWRVFLGSYEKLREVKDESILKLRTITKQEMKFSTTNKQDKNRKKVRSAIQVRSATLVRNPLQSQRTPIRNPKRSSSTMS